MDGSLEGLLISVGEQQKKMHVTWGEYEGNTVIHYPAVFHLDQGCGRAWSLDASQGTGYIHAPDTRPIIHYWAIERWQLAQLCVPGPRKETRAPRGNPHDQRGAHRLFHWAEVKFKALSLEMWGSSPVLIHHHLKIVSCRSVDGYCQGPAETIFGGGRRTCWTWGWRGSFNHLGKSGKWILLTSTTTPHQ